MIDNTDPAYLNRYRSGTASVNPDLTSKVRLKGLEKLHTHQMKRLRVTNFRKRFKMIVF